MNKKYIFILGAIGLLLILLIYIFRREQPPMLLNIDDPKETFLLEKSTDGKQCLVKGNANEFGVDNVIAASNTVDLQKYVGQKVHLKGKFKFVTFDSVQNCRLDEKWSFFKSGRIVFDVEEVRKI